MVKKRLGSSAQGRRPARSAKHIPDNQIDFSDIPELSEEQLLKARRVGRPRSGNAKQLIAIRLDPKLLAKLRKVATKKKKPYQTLMQELLQSAIKEVA